MMLHDVESIERATLAAVPPRALEELHGWLLGLDDGTVSRARSAVPLRHSAIDPAVLPVLEGRFAAHGLKPAFRIAQVNGLDALREALKARGYRPAKPTLVQLGKTDALAQLTQVNGVTLSTTPDEGWASVFLGEGFDPVDGASRVRILGRCQDALYASVRHEGGKTVAVGTACFSHGWVGVHGMRTALAHRGRGLASRILAALGRQAQQRGITRTLLQVEYDNPAQVLYRRAGFATAWVYEYWGGPSN